jgi:hypothetical protein
MDGIRAITALVAAAIFAYAGSEMMGLRSVSGDSLAEAFYQTMGLFSFGMTALCVTLAVPRSTPASLIPASASLPATPPTPTDETRPAGL